MKRRTILGLVAASAALLAPAAAQAASPVVSTSSATSVTQTSASLRASVNPEGVATTYYFQYGLTPAYTARTVPKSAGSGTKSTTVSTTVTGLLPATTYHYQVVATSLQGTAIGVDRTFTTKGPPAPGASTGGAVVTTRFGATVNGAVTTQGVATSWYFQYGLTTAYGANTPGGLISPNPAGPLAPVVAVNQVLTGLEPGVLFHYRLVAFRGSLPASVGADQTFFTFPVPRPRPSVRVRTLPTIAASKPYTFTTRGRLLAPSSLPAGVACNGSVSIRLMLGRRSVASRTATVAPNCTFASQVTFHKLIHGPPQHLTVVVRFRGNNYLLPANARSQGVRLGL